jgi:hypothetical protein
MARAGEYIDLTSALTLAAYGLEVTGSEFVKAMNIESFGMDRAEAIEHFEEALRRLQRSVLAGELELIGRFEPADKSHKPALSEPIPAQQLHDFVAFDYQVNGLRLGTPQLLWFAKNDRGYVQPKLIAAGFYYDIRIIRGQVRKHLGTGDSPARQAKNNPTLPVAKLENWYRALTPDERGLPIERLVGLAKNNHPTFHVPRQAVRNVVGSRPRGRPKKSANKKPAD